MPRSISRVLFPKFDLLKLYMCLIMLSSYKIKLYALSWLSSHKINLVIKCQSINRLSKSYLPQILSMSVLGSKYLSYYFRALWTKFHSHLSIHNDGDRLLQYMPIYPSLIPEWYVLDFPSGFLNQVMPPLNFHGLNPLDL